MRCPYARRFVCISVYLICGLATWALFLLFRCIMGRSADDDFQQEAPQPAEFGGQSGRPVENSSMQPIVCLASTFAA